MERSCLGGGYDLKSLSGLSELDEEEEQMLREIREERLRGTSSTVTTTLMASNSIPSKVTSSSAIMVPVSHQSVNLVNTRQKSSSIELLCK